MLSASSVRVLNISTVQPFAMPSLASTKRLRPWRLPPYYTAVLPYPNSLIASPNFKPGRYMQQLRSHASNNARTPCSFRAIVDSAHGFHVSTTTLSSSGLTSPSSTHRSSMCLFRYTCTTVPCASVRVSSISQLRFLPVLDRSFRSSPNA